MRVERLEGAWLVRAHLVGRTRDTTGYLLFDTGSPHLALDGRVARRLGVLDASAADSTIQWANHSVNTLRVGEFVARDVQPVFTVALDNMAAVLDRPLLGLLGRSVFSRHSIVFDREGGRLLLVEMPPDTGRSADPVHNSRHALGAWLPRDARPVRYEVAGGGKIILRGTLPGSSKLLTLILDTGATKTALFRVSLERDGIPYQRWPALRGFRSPTLYGDAAIDFVRVPRMSVELDDGSIPVESMDAAIVDGALSDALERDVQRTVHGLLGDSFLRRFRVVMDEAHQVLWLTPRRVARDERRFEYSTIGVQLARDGISAVVIGVADASPAALAGIAVGDTLTHVGATRCDRADLTHLARQLEGPPGSVVAIRVKRDGVQRVLRVTRRQLL